MLYRLDLTRDWETALTPMPFSDVSSMYQVEKDLENMLATNLFTVLFEDARLLPIFQERPRQPEADVYALNEAGDLVIFELKRGGAGRGAAHQVFGYAEEAGRWSYATLDQKYRTYRTDSKDPEELKVEHMRAFDLDVPLQPKEFNRRQELWVVGNAADEELLRTVDYWRNQGLAIFFAPYRIYSIADELYFEFFALPYDWHRNPADIKGVLFDTNASWDSESVWEMMEENRVAAYGGAKRFATHVQQGDIVFFSHKGRGVIAAAKVVGPTKAEGPDELYRDVSFLTPKPTRADGIRRALSFPEVASVTGKTFFWARTIKVPYLDLDEAESLLTALREALETPEAEPREDDAFA